MSDNNETINETDNLSSEELNQLLRVRREKMAADRKSVV